MGMTIDEAINYLITPKIASTEVTPEMQKQLDAHAIAIETMRKYQQLEDFARWVAEEIIDEDMWTYNHLSFAELACRKLVKLGIMQESDGEYSYEVVEDGND